MLGAEGVALGRGLVLLGGEATDFGGLVVDVTAEVIDDLLLLLLLLLGLVVVGGTTVAVPDGGRRGSRRGRILQQIETCSLERRGA